MKTGPKYLELVYVIGGDDTTPQCSGTTLRSHEALRLRGGSLGGDGSMGASFHALRRVDRGGKGASVSYPGSTAAHINQCKLFRRSMRPRLSDTG